MNLRICTQCSRHFIGQDCLHCQNETEKRSSSPLLGMALLLGLGVSACGSKDEDSGADTSETAEPAEEPSVEPADAPMYGVPQ